MYLLFLDESGTHGGSPVFVLAGLAIHEDDARHLQLKIDSFLHGRLTPRGLNAQEFELHATDIKNGNKEWAVVPYPVRLSILRGCYQTVLRYVVRDATFPLLCFGAVVDRRKVPTRQEREKHAYELVLNKFDDMLDRANRILPSYQRGLVIHDKRVLDTGRRAWTLERSIQEWTRGWQEVAGKVGQLKNFADIPLFADSRASRLIQAADLVAYALWRYYGLARPDPAYVTDLWKRFDAVGEAMHGMIHVSPNFAVGTCQCPPCQSRLDR